MKEKDSETKSVLGKRATKEELILSREAMFEKAKNIGFSEYEIREMKKKFGSAEEDDD